jgi:hypothetical protein
MAEPCGRCLRNMPGGEQRPKWWEGSKHERIQPQERLLGGFQLSWECFVLEGWWQKVKRMEYEFRSGVGAWLKGWPGEPREREQSRTLPYF